MSELSENLRNPVHIRAIGKRSGGAGSATGPARLLELPLRSRCAAVGVGSSSTSLASKSSAAPGMFMRLTSSTLRRRRGASPRSGLAMVRAFAVGGPASKSRAPSRLGTPVDAMMRGRTSAAVAVAWGRHAVAAGVATGCIVAALCAFNDDSHVNMQGGVKMNTAAPRRPPTSFVGFLDRRPAHVRCCMAARLMLFIWPQERPPFAVRSMLMVFAVVLSALYEDASLGKAPPQADTPLMRSRTPAG